MTKAEKNKILTDVQNGSVIIKEILPLKYGVVYPGAPFPKPIFLIDGRAVKAGMFFSKIINDNDVKIITQ